MLRLRKNAHSLPRSEYEGTGKRLFIGLVAGTATVLCVVLLLSWLVPTLGFAGIHPLLPLLAGLLVGGAIAFVLWLALGLVLYAYTGQPWLYADKLWSVTTRLLLPVMEVVGRLVGLPVETVRRSFIKVNNEMVLARGRVFRPGDVLVLLPHCVQSSRCQHRLTHNVDACTRCGACPLKDLLALRDAWGVKLAIAVGGTIARRIVVQARPRLIIAVACERDLASGIQDTCPLPVFGVINERPCGPCLDTQVSIERVQWALGEFVEGDEAVSTEGDEAACTEGGKAACTEDGEAACTEDGEAACTEDGEAVSTEGGKAAREATPPRTPSAGA